MFESHLFGASDRRVNGGGTHVDPLIRAHTTLLPRTSCERKLKYETYHRSKWKSAASASVGGNTAAGTLVLERSGMSAGVA